MRNTFVNKLDFLASPVAKMGCDWEKVKAVLDLQLTLDARRKSTASKKKGKREHGIFQMMALMYGISGVFTALIVSSIPDSYVRVSLGFFFIFLMAALIMITDYSAIILDKQGQFILQTKPIDQKSLHLAKLLHISVYMGFMTLVLGLPLLLLEGYYDGWQGVLICLLAYLGMDLITVVFTAFLYAGLLRLFSGEKLRDMIQYLQVGVTIIMMLSYQVFNQGIELKGASAHLSPAWWHLLLPSQWYASWMTTESGALPILLKSAGILLPIGMILLYMKILAPRFDSMLSRLDENKEKIDSKKLDHSMNRQRLVAKLFTRHSEESAGFIMGSRLLKRERKIQLIVIPQLALGIIFPLLIIMPTLMRGTSLSELRELPLYYALYMTGFMVLPLGIYGMKSEYFQAAWIFNALPIQSPNQMKRGLMKSFFVRYQLPVFIVPTLIFIGLYGLSALDEIVSIFFLLCFFVRLNHRSFGEAFPFSEDIAAIQDNKNKLLRMIFLNMAAIIVIGLLHAAVNFLLHASWVFLLFSMVLAIYAWETDRFLKKVQRES
ncbi:hypothetical protein SANA_26220 [Gottschalkiaceae bacterium SANA]|nr:hypothetical protein SANA_26220 [Gottschalkiaceae bacterium SANA]